jgi:serine/threonine protein kinase
MAAFPELKDYQVLGRIAVGGMAEIYRAKAVGGVVNGSPVALKRLLPQHRSDPAYVELFLAEARLGVMVSHPHVVRTYDLFRAGRDYFIVQELVEGESLAGLWEKAAAKGTRVELAAALTAISDLLEALGHLHSGAGVPGHPPIIHRDVNPTNLIVTPGGRSKLIDFGIAERQGGAVRERTGALRGTPAYMSPEQVKGRVGLDVRSDLYSAGIMVWELVAGRTLFQNDNEFELLRRIAEEGAPPLRGVIPTVPTVFERLCVRALAQDRSRRFASAEEFRSALHEACAREGLQLSRTALAAEVRRLAATA